MVAKKKVLSQIEALNAEVSKKIKLPQKTSNRKPAKDPIFSSSSISADSSLDEPLFGPEDPIFEAIASSLALPPKNGATTPRNGAIFLDTSDDSDSAVAGKPRKIVPKKKKREKKKERSESSRSSIVIDLANDGDDDGGMCIIDEDDHTEGNDYAEDDTPEPELPSEDENDPNNGYSTSREYTDSREESEDVDSDFQVGEEYVDVRKLYSNKKYREEVSRSYSTSEEAQSGEHSYSESILDDGPSSELDGMVLDSDDDDLPGVGTYKPPGAMYKGQPKRMGEEFFTDLKKTKRQIEKAVVIGIKSIETKRNEETQAKATRIAERKRLRYFDAFSTMFHSLEPVFLRHVKEVYEENFVSLAKDHLSSGDPLDYEALCADPSFCVYDMTYEEQVRYSSTSKWVCEACSESAQSIERFFSKSSEELRHFAKSLFLPGELRFFRIQKSSSAPRSFCAITGKLLENGSHMRAKLELRTSDPDKIRALYLDIHKDSQLLLATIHSVFHLAERIIQVFSEQYMRILSEKSFSRPRSVKAPHSDENTTTSHGGLSTLDDEFVSKQWTTLSGELRSLDQKHTLKSEYDRFMQLHERTRFFNTDPINSLV